MNDVYFFPKELLREFTQHNGELAMYDKGTQALLETMDQKQAEKIRTNILIFFNSWKLRNVNFEKRLKG